MRLNGLTLVVPTIGLALLLTGCPKRPQTSVASAPAPTPPPPAAAAPPTPAPAPPAPAPPVAAAPPTVAPTPPPAPPKEYVRNDNLKTIRFDFDKSAIRPGDAKILDANAAWLKANPNQLILIEGHCDERGTPEYNLALGDRRTKTATNYLVSQGVDASRITTISYGKERPLCTQQTEACWAQNRRDEFLTKER